MAIFWGTNGFDFILRDALSRGVRTDPPGLRGTGGVFGNTIHGLRGDDVIEASDGRASASGRLGDTIFGGTGHDRIYGGRGADWLHGGGGDDRLYGRDGDDELRGDGGDDRLSGGDGDDLMVGGAGDDDLYGGAGDDRLGLESEPEGDLGDDRMFGGAGDDVFLVDSRGDAAIELAGGGTDLVRTSLGAYVLPAEVEHLVFRPGAAIDRAAFAGNGLDNIIAVSLAAPDATVEGRAGDDSVSGGHGDDRLFGGSGRDSLRGYAGADLLNGGPGNDRLEAGWGSGDGVDRLIGGTGADIFVFDSHLVSSFGRRDVIEAGGGVEAFQGAGAAWGDRIDLSRMDGDTTDDLDPVPDFTPLRWGGFGKGRVACIDSGTDTLVVANVDDDRAFEFQLLIRDGAVRASDYAAADFILG